MDIRSFRSLEPGHAEDNWPALNGGTTAAPMVTASRPLQTILQLDQVVLTTDATVEGWRNPPGLAPWDPHVNLREFRDEAARTYPYTPLSPGADEATVNAQIDDLMRFLEAKRDHAARMAWPMNGLAPSSPAEKQRQSFFADLHEAMQGDLAALANWKSLSLPVRIGTFNAIARETNVEIKHNVSLEYDGKYWTEDEIAQIDRALSRLPDHLVLENDIKSFIRVGTIPGGFAGFNVAGRLRISDDAVADGLLSQYPGAAKAGDTSLMETILHETAHSFQNTPRFKEYSDIAGWRLVGPAGAYRNLPNGGEVKGSEVGITDDPDGIYILMNQSSRGSYVYRKGAEFGSSTYGRSNPQEDFAETLAEFLLDPESLKREAPHKYEFMASFASPRDPLQGWRASGLRPLGLEMLRA
jgi:hypothetical protein